MLKPRADFANTVNIRRERERDRETERQREREGQTDRQTDG